MNIISSWSGGKDSCLATYKAMKEGHEIKFLVNFISEETKRGCFHGIDCMLMKTQSEAIGIPIIQQSVPADMKEYENIFKKTVKELKEKHAVEGMVFGDIYLDEHREWVERVCKEIGITAIEPLWKQDPNIVASEFINLGFKSIITSAKAELFDKNFVGKDFNTELVSNLINRKICSCGENGEFHSFVYDGPIFNKKIEITKTETVYKDTFWKAYFLDIQKYSLIKKPN
ncbi:MAG: diphthine--ammonia ligase [Elusimicrobia bacterium]|nr:diphthine--ammonia ligase [Elusimicrobiota bacterium]